MHPTKGACSKQIPKMHANEHNKKRNNKILKPYFYSLVYLSVINIAHRQSRNILTLLLSTYHKRKRTNEWQYPPCNAEEHEPCINGAKHKENNN